MNQYSAHGEPAPRGDTAPRSGTQQRPPAPAAPTAGPHPRARRVPARHRKSSPSRGLLAGLALVSVLGATAITVTVDPAAPDPGGRPHLQSQR
ncbi:hypothetical protein AB0B01_10600 [Streptomyces sp. NPDC044571]|uniref:hypothetical protein n=1 Tax=Streptomyces sp. NPDC044571 TaxID=3155371 RepID=UPI0033F23842